MGGKGRIDSVPIILSFFVIFTIFELVLTLPISSTTTNRASRSVSRNRLGSWDENSDINLLRPEFLQQARRADVIAQRNNNSTTTGDGSNEADLGSGVGDGGNGTFSNDTQAGSRLRQNETEPCSLEPPSLCSSDPTHSNRDKQRRIEDIKNFLIFNLLGKKTPLANKEIVREQFSGGLESIPVSCDLPADVESDAWSSNKYFSLYFNLTSKYPDVYSSTENSSNEQINGARQQRQQQQQQEEEENSNESGQSHESVIGHQPFVSKFILTPNKGVNIISAKLRLYKTGISGSSDIPSLRTLEPSYNDTAATTKERIALPNVFSTRMTFPQFTPTADEKIRVSVFWYTQPATKNHYKKKLVDTKMLSMRESSWVDFDIKNAVAAWLNDRKPNYGLVVEVENENQDVLDPRKFFHGAPCFKSADKRDGAEGDEDSNNVSDSIPSSTSPVIEICTLNVSETSANKDQTKFPFPIPINIHSLNHLQQVDASHRSSNSSKTRSSQWQTINLNGLSPDDFRPTSVALPTRHRHRHHHTIISQNNAHSAQSESSEQEQVQNQRGKQRFSGPRGGFVLHEDHPLREILASVNGNSREAGKRQFAESAGHGFPSHMFSEMPADEGRVSEDYLDSSENERDVIITKIVITPAQLKENGLNRIANRRPFFPLASSASPPKEGVNAKSSER